MLGISRHRDSYNHYQHKREEDERSPRVKERRNSFIHDIPLCLGSFEYFLGVLQSLLPQKLALKRRDFVAPGTAPEDEAKDLLTDCLGCVRPPIGQARMP